MSELDELLSNKIVYIGDSGIPETLVNDKRPMFVLLGTPAELIAELQKREAELLKPTWYVVDKDSNPEQKVTRAFTTSLDAGLAREIIERHSNKTYWIVQEPVSQLKPTQVDDKGYDVESLLRRYSDKVKSDQEINPSVKGDESELL